MPQPPSHAARHRPPLRVLAASDLTPRSIPLLLRSRRLAPNLTHLLHVLDSDLPPALLSSLRPAARASLCAEAAMSGLLADGLPEIAIGLPHLTIAEVARRMAATLILMGRHRQEVLGEVFVGTTVERVIRQADRPVLVCHDSQAGAWQQVMFTTDLSAASLAAAQWLAASGLAQGARVILAHAFTPLGQGFAPRTAPDGPAWETRQEHEILKNFAKDAGLPEAECQLLPGSPVAAITALVAERQPDLVVMGTRGPSGLLRGMIGSVAQALLRGGQQDMLAIPPFTPLPGLDAGLPDPAASSNQEGRPTGAE